MTDQRFDQLLRDVTGDPVPTDADVARMRSVMTAEIRSGSRATTARRPLRWIVATAIVAVVVVIAQMIAPSAAVAALQEIAQAAESTTALVAPTGQYTHAIETTTRMGQVDGDAFADSDGDLVYFLETTYEWWVGQDDVRRRTTVGQPSFLSAADEERYFAAGLDQTDMIGQTVVETATGVTSVLDEREWPTDPTTLDELLRSLVPEGTERPERIEVLDLALDLLREAETPADLRSAAVTVIAGLEPELVERTEDGGGVFAFEWSTPIASQIIVSLDGDGQLIRERLVRVEADPDLGLDPGTVIEDTTYSGWEVVDATEVP